MQTCSKFDYANCNDIAISDVLFVQRNLFQWLIKEFRVNCPYLTRNLLVCNLLFRTWLNVTANGLAWFNWLVIQQHRIGTTNILKETFFFYKIQFLGILHYLHLNYRPYICCHYHKDSAIVHSIPLQEFKVNKLDKHLKRRRHHSWNVLIITRLRTIVWM